MKYRAKALSDVEAIFKKFEYGEWKWRDVKGFVENSPQFFKYSGVFDVVKYDTNFNCNIYKIRKDFFDKGRNQYGLKKRKTISI